MSDAATLILVGCLYFGALVVALTASRTPRETWEVCRYCLHQRPSARVTDTGCDECRSWNRRDTLR